MIKFSNRQPINWRMDDDGHLRVTICALKEGVYAYGAEESPDVANLEELRGLDTIREYIPLEAMRKEEALASLEGKDIIVGCHDWQTPENYEKAQIVGSVAGTPHIEGDELIVDAIIKCPETIANITSARTPEDEKYVEVSAGYEGDLMAESGTFEDEQYDAKQTNFRFNHILLLPLGQGRCGSDVRILNSIPKEGNVAVTVKMRIGNTERTFRFTNEEDAKEAEVMVEEERKFNAEQVEESLAQSATLKTQISDLQAQLAEHDANLKSAQQELEAAIGEETQEILAAEMAEQSEDETEIANAEIAENEEVTNEDDAEKKGEEFLNSIRKNADGSRVLRAMRRENCVRTVMKNQGAEIPETWKQEAFDAAFKTLAVQARIKNKKRTEAAKVAPARIVNGKPTPGKPVTTNQDNRSRMLNAMRNKKEAKNNG